MNKYLQAMLVQPTTDWKHRKLLEVRMRPHSQTTVDLTTIKQQLRQQRIDSLENLPDLIEQTIRNLEQIEGVCVHWAEDFSQAAAIINEIPGVGEILNINNSGTIREIMPAINEKNIELHNTYFEKADSLDTKFEFFWQLPKRDYQPDENWFTVGERIRLNCNEKQKSGYSRTSLVGVNAISAEDGTIFMLHHSDNMKDLLHADRVILLVGLEKIVHRRKEAEFQTKWAGNFGMESILLNLHQLKNKGNPGSKDDPNEENSIEGGPKTTASNRRVDVILLDNGRLKMLESSFWELLLCFSCRACLKRCPTYKYFSQNSGYYPQQYLFSFLIGQSDSIELCTHAGNCFIDCPLSIDIPMLMTKAKALKGSDRWHFGDKVMANPELLAEASSMASPLSDWLLQQKIVRQATELVLGIHRDRQLPTAKRKEKRITRQYKKIENTVIFYPGCYAKYFEPEVLAAAIKLLQQSGLQVLVPIQKCCGMPSLGLGDETTAAKKAKTIIESLSKADYAEMAIITTCPSCSLALKHDYTKLGLHGASQVAERVIELDRYFIDRYNTLGNKPAFKPLDLNIAYHMPCHQKALCNLRVSNREEVAPGILDLVPGLSVNFINRGCCGMSGTFGQKKRYYELSMNTGNPLFEAIKDLDFDMVCTECGPCKMQIAQGTGKKTVHPILLLAESAGLI